MQQADDDWTAEALHALRADLARVRGDTFQRASELRTDGDGRYAVVSTASGRTVGEGLSKSRAEALANEHGPAFKAQREGQR